MDVLKGSFAPRKFVAGLEISAFTNFVKTTT
jgi:hypothetical protein